MEERASMLRRLAKHLKERKAVGQAQKHLGEKADEAERHATSLR
jgi:hypothetical protein